MFCVNKLLWKPVKSSSLLIKSFAEWRQQGRKKRPGRQAMLRMPNDAAGILGSSGESQSRGPVAEPALLQVCKWADGLWLWARLFIHAIKFKALKLLKIDTNTSCLGCEATRTHIHINGRKAYGTVTLERTLRHCNEIQQTPNTRPGNTPRIYLSKRERKYVHKKTGMQTSTECLLLRDKHWKQLRSLPTDEWMIKWHTHTME